MTMAIISQIIKFHENTLMLKNILYLMYVWLFYEIHRKVAITGGDREEYCEKIFEPRRQKVKEGGEN